MASKLSQCKIDYSSNISVISFCEITGVDKDAQNNMTFKASAEIWQQHATATFGRRQANAKIEQLHPRRQETSNTDNHEHKAKTETTELELERIQCEKLKTGS